MDISSLLTLINDHSSSILACLIPLEVLTLVLLIVFALRANRQAARVAKLLQTESGTNLEQIINQFLEQARQADIERKDLLAELARLRQDLRPALQRTGFHRFNAFPGVGGELSFSIALLDANLDGLIVTSIYGREDARVYAKQVKAGQAVSLLSDEEQLALLAATSSRTAAVSGH